MLEQSVIYQEIMQRGVPVGEVKLLLMMLEHRIGKLSPLMQKRIKELPVPQVEALGKASYTFTSKDDLRGWLKQQTPKR